MVAVQIAPNWMSAGCRKGAASAACGPLTVELDARGIPAARAGKWSAVQVSRLLARVNPSTVQRVSRRFEADAVAAPDPRGRGPKSLERLLCRI